MNTLDIIGNCGIITTIIVLIPQLVTTYKTRSVNEISFFTIAIFIINSLLWATYGILQNAMALTWANVIFLVNASLLMYFKLRYTK